MHEKYPLIIASNRDEYFDRETKQLHYWENEDLYAGKDLRSGGTWFAFRSNGNFALVTNFRMPSKVATPKRSRGELPLLALRLMSDQKSFEHQLAHTTNDYQPYTLVWGNLSEIRSFCSQTQSYQRIQEGIVGLSNADLNEDWPKVRDGKNMLARQIKDKKTLTCRDLLGFLQNPKPYPHEQLPNTGIDPKTEIFLSSVFISNENYGTRSSTALLVSPEEQSLYALEQHYVSSGTQGLHTEFTVTL